MRNYKPTEFISAMLHSTGVENTEFKTCKKCGETKKVKDFSINSKLADGHTNVCKKCDLIAANARYQKRKAEKELYRSFMPI